MMLLINVEIMYICINGNINMNEIDIFHDMNHNDTMLSLMKVIIVDEMICMLMDILV